MISDDIPYTAYTLDDESANSDGAIMFPTVVQSKSLEYQRQTVTNARLLIDVNSMSDVNDFVFYLTADGGINWEEVTVNQNHTFTNTGDDVRYQILGNSGSYIRVRLSNGSDKPIKVITNEEI